MSLDQLSCIRSLQGFLDQTDFPQYPGIVDLHTHIIPNADDGSQSVDFLVR